MNWYPNPTQLLGLNLNGYTNLTLQSHMAQRGLNLPFQLNQFQGIISICKHNCLDKKFKVQFGALIIS